MPSSRGSSWLRVEPTSSVSPALQAGSLPTEPSGNPSESHCVMSDSLWPYGLYSPWNSLDQNTGVGSLSLLQGIFPTQRSNPGLPHCRWILYHLSHQGSPRILEWVASSFCRGSSRPRSQTRVSCIAGRFFTTWAIREAKRTWYCKSNILQESNFF